MTLTSSTFDTNAAGNGGGLWSNDVLTVKNATFWSNAADLGGAIFLSSGAADLYNVTVAGNTAGPVNSTGTGGGTYQAAGALTMFSTMTMRTRRVWSGAMALLITVGVPGTMVATTAGAAAGSPCAVTNTTTGVTFTDLQKAVTKARAGKTLRISGTCVGNFTVRRALTLRKGASAAILKGNGSTVLTVSGSPVTLIGLRITGGRASVCPGEPDWVCGGGVANTGVLYLVDTMVAGNAAAGGSTRSALGGGIFIESGSVSLTNSTITGNSVSGGGSHGNGGGIYGSSTNLTVRSSTIAGNHVTAPSGMGGGISTNGVPGVSSTIIAGNTADTGRDCTMNDPSSSQGHNLIGSGASCLGFQDGVNHDQVGTNNASVDPKLAPLAANGGPTKTRALKAGSPAVDAGEPTMCDTSRDQRDVTRPKGAGCDIGPFERS